MLFYIWFFKKWGKAFMNKKVTFFTALIALMFSLSACGNNLVPEGGEQGNTPSESTTQQPQEITGLSFANKTVTYNGMPQSIYVTGLPSDVRVVYEGNEQTNVGVYTVTASFEVDKTKYIQPEKMTATLTINKATFNVKNLQFNSATFVYDGNVHYLVAFGYPTNDFVVTYTNNNKIDAGEYLVTAHFEHTSENYNDIADQTATLTITQARYNYNIEFYSNSYDYDGQSHSLVVSGNLPEGVSVTYTNNDQTEPGEYTVTAHFASTGNYKAPNDMTATLTINKGYLYLYLGTQSFPYDGQPHTMEATETIPEGVSVEYSNNVQTEPGVYVVTATIHGGDHYVDSEATGIMVIDNSNVSSNGLLFYEDTYNGHASVTGIGTCTDKDVVIPAIYNNLPVTYLSSSVFQNNDFVESVTMPNTITSIGRECFSHCSKLKTIKFSDNITYLSGTILFDCSAIEELDLPKNLADNNGSIACQCPKLKTIHIHDGWVIDQYYSLFSECPSIETIVIDDNSENFALQDGVLYNKDKTILYMCPCAKTGSVTVPDSVIEVRNYAFCDCTNLHTISLPNSITKLGKGAFWNCASLSIFHIPNQVTEIPESLCYQCNSLTSVNIPNSVTKIGYSAFGWCYNIKQVSITDSVTQVGSNAFEYCDDLYYHGSVLNWVTTAHKIVEHVDNVHLFIDGSNYEATSITIPNGVSVIEKGCFQQCKSLVNVTVEGEVETIESYAFYNCKNLKTITLPNGLTSIDEWAFRNCSALESISFGTGLKTIGNCAFADCFALESVAFNDGLETIGQEAFGFCYSLESINIPNSVTSLGSDAFYKCHSLKSAILGNGLETIKSSTFNECSSLASISIPSGVTTIESSAFYGCASLRRITIPSSVTNIADGAFARCQIVEVINLSSLNIEVGASTYGQIAKNAMFVIDNINASQIEEDENGFITYDDGVDVTLLGYSGSEHNIVIPNGVTKIAPNAFENNDNITRVNIPNSVTTVGTYAFSDCENLCQVIVGSGVNTLPSSAFSRCYGLVEVINKSSVDNVFFTNTETSYVYTRYLTNSESNSRITVDSNGYVVYEEGADHYLVGYEGNAKDIIIPTGVTKIYKRMFDDDHHIQSVVIPTGVTEIGEYSFTNCSNLRTVSVPDTLTTVTSSFLSDDLLEYRNYHGAHYLGNDLNPYVLLFDTDNNENSRYFMYQLYIHEGTVCIASINNLQKLVEIINESSLTITKGSGIAKYVLAVITDENDSKLHQYSDGYVMYIDGDDRILVDYESYQTPFAVPDGTTEINRFVLYYSGCHIEGIIIPDSVTEIGDHAFCYINGDYIIFGSGMDTLRSSVLQGASFKYVVLDKAITTIEDFAFLGNHIEKFYYTGNETEFNAISVGLNNSDLSSATVYFYSDVEPTESGNFWHYVDGVITIW